MMRLEDLLRDYARQTGAKYVPGFVAEGFSFVALDEASERLAGVIQAQGVLPGERVAILMDNGTAALVAIFAALKAGAACCPVDVEADSEDLSFVLNDCPVACLIVDARFAPVAAAAMAEAPLLRLVVIAGAEGAPAVDGLLRYEDAILAEPRALLAVGTALASALHLYPKSAAAGSPCRSIAHAEIVVATQAPADAPPGPCLDSMLLAIVAAMRADTGSVSGVAA
ncbi:MAG: class I adenylate-forming enzyme family protein [Bauldia sp.]